MKKMTDDEGYGACDEVNGPDETDECKGCKGCAVTADERKKQAFTLANPEDTKTQTVRIRVTDLATLQALKEHDDETPGGVMHRVLDEYAKMLSTARYEGGEFDTDEATIKKYESLIQKQKEKVSTQRREIDEQKNTIKVLKSASADTGENVSEIQKEFDDKLTKFQDQREEMLDTMNRTNADHQAELTDREMEIADLKDELEEMSDITTERICDGPGTTINIIINKGSRTGIE